jgi:hypothetical protein
MRRRSLHPAAPSSGALRRSSASPDGWPCGGADGNGDGARRRSAGHRSYRCKEQQLCGLCARTRVPRSGGGRACRLPGPASRAHARCALILMVPSPRTRHVLPVDVLWRTLHGASTPVARLEGAARAASCIEDILTTYAAARRAAILGPVNPRKVSGLPHGPYSKQLGSSKPFDGHAPLSACASYHYSTVQLRFYHCPAATRP